MNKTKTFKTVAAIGGGAVAVGAAAFAAKKALDRALVLPDGIFSNINEKGSLARGVEKDLFKNANLTESYKSHNGIGEGLGDGEKKADKKTIISELVEKPYFGENKLPAQQKKESEPEKLTGEFLKSQGMNYD